VPRAGKRALLMQNIIIVGALVASQLLAAAPAAAPTWQADLAHCRAEFTVSHMVVSKVWGHIPVRRLDITGASGSAIPTHVEVLLDVAHEDTDNHDRDADLRSPTYFDVAKYPSITFASTSIVPKDSRNFVVTGDLTIKNVTKSVTFPMQIVGIIPEGNGSWRVGYNGQFQLDRRDWGIVDSRLTPAGVLLVGYTVNVGLTVEAVTNDPHLHAMTS
jgi:polyisoprenoid-binding protein YceI